MRIHFLGSMYFSWLFTAFVIPNILVKNDVFNIRKGHILPWPFDFEELSITGNSITNQLAIYILEYPRPFSCERGKYRTLKTPFQ